MIAFALLPLIACSTTRSAARTDAGPAHEAAGPVTLTEKRFSDGAGNTVTIHLNGPATEAMVITGKDGQRLPLHEYDLAQVSVCLPRTGKPASTAPDAVKPLCQPMASMTQGAFLKLGTATCICGPVGQKLKCYGDTCR